MDREIAGYKDARVQYAEGLIGRFEAAVGGASVGPVIGPTPRGESDYAAAPADTLSRSMSRSQERIRFQLRHLGDTTLRLHVRSPLKVVAIPAQAESRGGHQEQAENHEILKRVDHPRPSE